jgi:hypothetical protein
MASQRAILSRFIRVAEAALVALALVILFGKLDGSAGRLVTDLVGAASRTALDVSLSLLPAAWQVLQAYAFDHPFPCPLQMLASLWPLLHVITGAA